MDIHKRALVAARIFDILAWVVLVVSGLGFLVGMFTLFSEFSAGLLLMLGSIIYGALSWAYVTLAVVIAGYVARRTAPMGEAVDGQ